jgi:hypothetical protein
MNNKEMFFTQQAEAILQELCRKGMERDDSMDNTENGSLFTFSLLVEPIQ